MKQIGTDIETISRFKDHLGIAAKILHPKEMELYNSFESDKRKQEYVAGRWVAKEAITKALDHIPAVKEIHIYLDNNELKVEYKDEDILLSISHSNENAIAFCIRR